MENLKTMNDMLAVVRQFYGDKGIDPAEKKKLWDVLSALRGPDEAEIRGFYAYDVKEATTTVIRDAVLGGSTSEAGLAVWEYASIDRDFSGAKDRRTTIMPEYALPPGVDKRPHHFLGHARNAFDALGLKWDEVNPPVGSSLAFESAAASNALYHPVAK